LKASWSKDFKSNGLILIESSPAPLLGSIAKSEWMENGRINLCPENTIFHVDADVNGLPDAVASWGGRGRSGEATGQLGVFSRIAEWIPVSLLAEVNLKIIPAMSYLLLVSAVSMPCLCCV
jgi:hypothetical protein